MTGVCDSYASTSSFHELLEEMILSQNMNETYVSSQ